MVQVVAVGLAPTVVTLITRASLPEGMKDVSFYPNLVRRFLELENPVADIEKVMSGNLVRAWQANMDYAERVEKG